MFQTYCLICWFPLIDLFFILLYCNYMPLGRCSNDFFCISYIIYWPNFHLTYSLSLNCCLGLYSKWFGRLWGLSPQVHTFFQRWKLWITSLMNVSPWISLDVQISQTKSLGREVIYNYRVALHRRTNLWRHTHIALRFSFEI